METPTFVTDEQTREELRRAKQARWGFVLLADDPSTWPADMQERRAELQADPPKWEGWDYDEPLFNLKVDLLQEAVLARLGDDYRFVEAAIRHFMSHLPAGSLESALAHELEGSVYFLVKDTVAACLDLVPRLHKVFPWEGPADIYAAMMASDGQTSEEESEN